MPVVHGCKMKMCGNQRRIKKELESVFKRGREIVEENEEVEGICDGPG